MTLTNLLTIYYEMRRQRGKILTSSKQQSIPTSSKYSCRFLKRRCMLHKSIQHHNSIADNKSIYWEKKKRRIHGWYSRLVIASSFFSLLTNNWLEIGWHYARVSSITKHLQWFPCRMIPRHTRVLWLPLKCRDVVNAEEFFTAQWSRARCVHVAKHQDNVQSGYD